LGESDTGFYAPYVTAVLELCTFHVVMFGFDADIVTTCLITAEMRVVRLPLGLLVEKPRNCAVNLSGGLTGAGPQEKSEGCNVSNGKRGFSGRGLCSLSINLKPEYQGAKNLE